MTIIREERIGNQRLILGDCLEVMPTLGRFDAVVTDPPFGIGYAANPIVGKGKKSSNHSRKSWDNTIPDMARVINAAPRHIIWGGNYFNLPPSRGWLSWFKPDAPPSMGQFELAWTSIDRTTRQLSQSIAATNKERVGHPTQKPLALIEWCLGFLPDAKTVLDPFCGSGTTLVACQRMGKQGTGIERDPDYFEVMCRRVDEATRQADLFIAPTVKPTQEAMEL